MKQIFKTSVLSSAILMAAMAAGNVNAGGIQIDTNGAAPGGNILSLAGLGASVGNYLAQNALFNNGANITPDGTTIYGQNSIDIGSPQCPDCELTLLFSIPMTSSLDGSELSMSQNNPGTFKMWFDTSSEGWTNNNVDQGQQVTGVGYGDGVLLLEGAITIVPPMLFNRTNSLPIVLLDPPTGGVDKVDTIQGGGSGTLNVDLTFQAPGFVLNNLTGSALDLQVQLQTRLNYTNTAGNRASTKFADVNSATPNVPSITPFYGVPDQVHGAELFPLNDFGCAATIATGDTLCDFQAQMNTTFLFFETPEPGTVALLGAGLSIFGGLSLRRRKKA